MILTSFRCYMNAIVPTTNKETLLKSHYYVLDVVANDQHSNSVEWSTEGVINVRTPRSNNNFRVVYCSEILNPAPHTAPICYMDKPGGACMANKQADYLRHLMNTDTMSKIYNAIFDSKSCTDDPKILIMFDEENIVTFGSTLAMYFSQVFGVDVEFIDESLRPNVFGNKSGIYIGNKAQGEQTVRLCKNHKIIKDIKLMITEYSKEETQGNLMSQFTNYKTPELIYIYNTLFPDKPLFEGMYTRDDMMKILIGTICEDIDFNQGYSYEECKEAIGTYEQNLSDWEQLEEDYRMELLRDALNNTGE